MDSVRGVGLLLFVLCLPAAATADRLAVISVNLQSKTDAAPLGRELDERGLGDADVYLLQEVIGEDETTSAVARRLASSLRSEALYRAAFELAPGRMYGLAILSRLPLSDVTVIPLPRNDLRVRSRVRIALAASVQSPFGTVHVVNTHLDTRIGISGRLRQMEPIIAHIDTQPYPAVVGGDMNTNRHRWLFHMVPIPYTQNQEAGLLRYMEQRGFRNAIPERRATHDLLGMRLDWVFLRDLAAEDGTVHPLRHSDHHALRVVVRRDSPIE